jgi:hypothetical protein
LAFPIFTFPRSSSVSFPMREDVKKKLSIAPPQGKFGL